MKQQLFVETHEKTWLEIEEALQNPAQGENSRVLSEHYMLLCHHLAIAKELPITLMLTPLGSQTLAYRYCN